MLPIQLGLTAQCRRHWLFWHNFFFKFEHAGLDVTDRNGRLARFKFKKNAPNGHYYLQPAVTRLHLTRSISTVE
jgi:hypothetical protein